MATCPIIYVDDPASSATADDAPMINGAIAAANASGGVVQFGAGPYQLRSRLDPITHSDVVLRGCESFTTLVAKGSYSGLGNFFRFGTEATGSVAAKSANDSGVTRFRLEIDDGVTNFSPNVFAVEYVNGVGMWGANIRCEKLAGIVSFGTTTTMAKRCSLNDWRGNLDRGGQTSSNVLFKNCTGIRLADVSVSGSLTENGQGAFVRFNPSAGNIVDGVRMWRCGFQFLVESPATTGKPRSIYIQRSAAPITNLVFESCIFDHSSVLAVDFSATDAAPTDGEPAYTRLIRFSNCRFFTDRGGGIKLTHTGHGVVRNFMVTGCNISVEDDAPAFELAAAGKKVGLVLVNNTFNESRAVTKTQAVLLNGNNWICANNMCGTVSEDGVERFSKAFVISGTGSDGFLMGPNLAAPGIPQKLEQPASYTVNPGTRQIV